MNAHTATPGVWQAKERSAPPTDGIGSLHRNNRDANADIICRAANCQEDLDAIAKIFERTNEYEINRSTREGDDEGARMKLPMLAKVQQAIAVAEGRL